MKKQVGSKGYLFKRKVFGETCPECVDWDTGDVAKSSCTVCYGTGFVGGYWNPFSTYIDTNLIPRNKQHTDQAGIIEPERTQARMLGYPHVSTYDFFADYDTGKRWVIRNVQNAAELRGQPLIYLADIRLAPFTDPIYEIPLPEEPPEPGCNVAPPAGYEEPTPEPEPEPAIPVAEVCQYIAPGESSILTPTSSSVLIPTSSVLTPEATYGGGRNWLWYQDKEQRWYLSENPELDAFHWYRTDTPRTQYYELVPYNTWNEVGGALPVPTFDVASLSLTVSGAGSPEVNGTYEFQGTLNGAYLFQQQLP